MWWVEQLIGRWGWRLVSNGCKSRREAQRIYDALVRMNHPGQQFRIVRVRR